MESQTRLKKLLLASWLEYILFLRETKDESWKEEKIRPTFTGFMDYLNVIVDKKSKRPNGTPWDCKTCNYIGEDFEDIQSHLDEHIKNFSVFSFWK